MKGFKLVYSLLFAASFTAVSAQVSGQSATAYGDGRNISARADKAAGTTGSMYFEEKFLPAKVSNIDTPVLARYNAFNDEFEYTTAQNQSPQTVDRQEGVTVTFTGSGKAYSLVNYKTEKGVSASGYLSLISESSKVKFYKRESIYLQPAKEGSSSYQAAKAAAYKHSDDEFYVKLGNAEPTYFDGKKEFAKLVPGKNKEVLDYIKSNSIDLEETADLQKLATYVETLI